MFILKVFILINNQLMCTANAKDFNTDYFCYDFRNKSNGIIVVGGNFFFCRQVSTFQLAIFDGNFFISFKKFFLS